MKIGGKLIQFSINSPKLVTAIMIVTTLVLGAMISKVQVDTDPENMLSEHEAVRVFHNQTKQEFSLYDVIVVGIINEQHKDGVFNPVTLKKVEQLTDFAMQLSDPDDPTRRVVSREVMAPGNVDNIEQAGPGQVRFEWLMKKAPSDREGSLKVRDNAMANPLLKGTLVAEDGKAMALYLPITSKDFAYTARKSLLDKISTFDNSNGDQFHITGLPVAEDTFGVEMFVQMAVSAPLAMLAIFLLMLIFFKKIKLVAAPMIIALVTVICTMGLLIGTGHTLHIMSSMIPIFLMPIAVVDSIHILSEFFDTYQQTGDRRKTLEKVMGHLFVPMLYTSLTSSAGFASLALTPIPPVQSFGIFVSVGIMLAWFLTIVFVPAYIMMMKEENLQGFGVSKESNGDSFLSRQLRRLGSFTYNQAKLIIVLTLVVMVGAGFGISKIQINDNPVKWFKKSHEIRVADRVLNKHFGGTYEAYLILQGDQQGETVAFIETQVREKVAALMESNSQLVGQAEMLISAATAEQNDADAFLADLSKRWEETMDAAPDETYELWADGLDILDAAKNRRQIFKDPQMLNYIAKLQEYLLDSGLVGKSNSVTDVTKKVHQELFESDPGYYRVPATGNGVAQVLMSFQNSHKPGDLWHLVTPDYSKANIWIQLKSGDNKDMEEVLKSVDAFFVDNPPPSPLLHQWAGLTYLNVVWQDKMVSGMAKSFLSSFVVVFLMMAFLFRSPVWGALAMIPLSVTIASIYGLIGFIGKDYDMPVAVLSSLTLGLAIDFAIHFLERTRMVYRRLGSWKETIKDMFEEPARAITRNVIVISVGFTPLLASSLMPYKTVGIFLASIMAISGVSTMFILPGMITVMQGWLFKNEKL